MMRYLFFVVVLFTSGLLGAQHQTARFEREQKNSDSDYVIISLQKKDLHWFAITTNSKRVRNNGK